MKNILQTSLAAFVLVTLAVVCAAAQQPANAGNQSVGGYILGSDDQILIRALDAEEISEKPVLIGTNGYITLPMVGRLRAGGLTVEQLETEIVSRLKPYILEPQVSVSVVEFGSQPVSVLGAVAKPDVVQLRGRKNLFEVLALAGGLRPEAGDSIKITRRLENGRIPLPNAADDQSGQFSIAEVNIKEIMEAKNPKMNIEIKPNDVISVPKADMVYVVGEVARSGGIVLTDRKSVSALEVLSLAGGLGPTASPNKAKILRNVPGALQRQEIAVKLGNILKGKSPDVIMQPNDILVVPSSTGKKILTSIIPGIISAGTSTAIYTTGR